MLERLADARNQSLDPPDGPALVVSSRPLTGRPGRPSVQIDRTFFFHALQLRGPTQLAAIFRCSSRTVRRRAIEYEFVEPGEPVFIQEVDEEGNVQWIYNLSTTAPVSDMSDDDLDARVLSILEIFPAFGRRMIQGSLRAMGHRVPVPRVAQSYLRVHGVPGSFGPRRLQHRQYHVPGPLSLVHHDGQHGEACLPSDK